MGEYQKILELLKNYKQEKIVKELERNRNEELEKQILSIDFEKVEEIKEIIKQQTEGQEMFHNDIIEKIDYIDSKDLTIEEKEECEKIGEEIIKNGKYAVVTMAGGQRNKTWI